MKIPELLAPAGSWEAFVAAVEAGADAVYLGGTMFSARRYANNFSNDQLVEAVRYAHLRGVAVHVTINTLIKDEEFDQLLPFAAFLDNSEVDAVIVQDLGVVKVLREAAPQLPIHASTQMTVHNIEGAKLAEELGCGRVVLARELPIPRIKAIKDAVQAEVEVFVHGAMCFAYSGQCLMSSLIGGRSGNRGMCAQPCRMEYKLAQVGTKLPGQEASYLLSCRDLAGLELLPQLVGVGVDSLKIEGRMKRPEYVATVVSTYRQALDSLAAGEEAYYTDREREQLAQIFNRGFTTGYLAGNPGHELITYGKPSNRGLPLGTVRAVNSRRRRAQVQLERPLRVGDGIEFAAAGGLVVRFIDRSLDRQDQAVDGADPGQLVWVEAQGGVQPGTQVFKTSDVKLLETAREYYQGESRRTVDLWLHLQAKIGQPLKLTGWDTDGHRVTITSEFVVDRARKRPTTQDDVAEKLSRLGDTHYRLAGLQVDMDSGVMVPFSELNNLRREVAEGMSRSRLKRRTPGVADHQPAQRKFKVDPAISIDTTSLVPQLTVKAGSWQAAQAAWQAGADTVYLGGEVFAPAAQELLDPRFWQRAAVPSGRRLVISTPRIISDEEMGRWQELVTAAIESSCQAVLTGNLGLLRWALETGIPVCGDFSLNVFNTKAAAAFFGLGTAQLTLSVELTWQQVQWIGAQSLAPALEIVVHGDLPMMVTEHNLVDAQRQRQCSELQGRSSRTDAAALKSSGYSTSFYLEDRKGMLLPVEVDQSGRTHLFNGAELNTADSAETLYQTRIGSWRIEGQRCGPKRLGTLTLGYRSIIDALAAGKMVPEACVKAIADAARAQTRGHFFRGVQ